MPDNEPAVLTAEQMSKGIERLQRRITDLEAFNPEACSDAEVSALKAAIDESVIDTFGRYTLD